MNDIFEYLKDRYSYWGWLGQRAHDAAAINRVLPLDFILCCDYGIEVPLYFNEHDILSLEKELGVRKNWSNEDLKKNLNGELGKKFFGRLKDNTPPGTNIICYRSLSDLEHNVSSGKYNILAPSEDKKRYFDNKILLHRKLPGLGLDRIPGREDHVGAVDFKSLLKEFSLPFVVRFPYGSSGQFVFIIKDEWEYRDLLEKYEGQIAVFERHIKGFSLNVNAVIVDTSEGSRVVCSFPSVQLTGLPECSSSPSSFCGNDFSAAVDIGKNVLKQVFDVTKRIGDWMAGCGFRGLFGLDMIIFNEKIYPLEINPRFQNSTALFDTLQFIAGNREKMLFLLHILQFLQYDDIEARKQIEKYDISGLLEPVYGAQVILHNLSGREKLKGMCSPGIYKYEESSLKHKRPAAVLTGEERPGEILVTCGVPEKGKTVENNAPLCKVQCLDSVVDSWDKTRLNKAAQTFISNIYKYFLPVEGRTDENAADFSLRENKV